MLVELFEVTLAALDEVMFVSVRVPVALTTVEELEEMLAELLVRVLDELVVIEVLLIVANDAAVVVDVA
ncbi:MAG: hypothetical protein ACLPY5_00725 [Candidatus Bathyarchaeia archaeon]